MEINKGVSAPHPCPVPASVLPTRGQNGQRRQQAVCQRPVARSGSSQVPNSREAILSLFPHPSTGDKIYFTVDDCEDFKEPNTLAT